MDHSAKSAIAETDPVCGMSIDPASAKHKFEHAGKAYYFCCAGCREKFRADPDRYLSQSAASASAMHSGTHVVNIGSASGAKRSLSNAGIVPLSGPAEAKKEKQIAYVCPMCPEVRASRPGACPRCGMALEPEMPASAARVEYTCPMHPQIVRPGPGSCPICGMTLEPRTVTAHDEDSPELREMTRRFWISLVLTAPLLAIAMADMLPGMPVQRLIPAGWLAWIELASATPVVLWGGWPFFQRGWASVVNRSTNMFTLIAMGTGVA
jgi:Cu+-exporting ATPase